MEGERSFCPLLEELAQWKNYLFQELVESSLDTHGLSWTSNWLNNIRGQFKASDHDCLQTRVRAYLLHTTVWLTRCKINEYGITFILWVSLCSLEMSWSGENVSVLCWPFTIAPGEIAWSDISFVRTRSIWCYKLIYTLGDKTFSSFNASWYAYLNILLETLRYSSCLAHWLKIAWASHKYNSRLHVVR